MQTGRTIGSGTICCCHSGVSGITGAGGTVRPSSVNGRPCPGGDRGWPSRVWPRREDDWTRPWCSDRMGEEANVTQARTIVILGGGVGGVVAARELRRRLPRPHRIVLVDREREHLFAPSLLWLMVGQRKAASIRRPLSRLERKGIEVRIGEEIGRT